MIKIVVTGAGGLLGWHASARLHARNCTDRFQGKQESIDLVRLNRTEFSDPTILRTALTGADAVLHFAGVNRGTDHEVADGNPHIAEVLAAACQEIGARPHIVYANSTHAAGDTVYGRSKRRAGQVLAACTTRYTEMVLPHIFGEGARPDYNNVTATFINRVIAGVPPEVTPGAQVQLLHAGEAVEMAISAVLEGRTGRLALAGRPTLVKDLLTRISEFNEDYSANLFPDLSDPFDLALFNSYRAALYPERFPQPLKLHMDPRGTLFEASRSAGGGGQTFLSWTHPGVTRGNHFHLSKVERFLVLEGEAIIRIRRVLDDRVWEYCVKGEEPTPVDMPTLHTHSIQNTGDRPLLTLFWTQETFDRAAPDTYADPVLGN